MARGGSRQGTPGKGYANRTDLMTNRKPADQTLFTPASGGVAPPAASAQPQPAQIYPEDIPKLNDPTARPNEPLTTGLWAGPGAGPSALGWTPPDPIASKIEAAYALLPTPELRSIIKRFRAKGVL